MGKGGYLGGSTVVGPTSGWFTFKQRGGGKRKNAKPLLVPERADGSSPNLGLKVAKERNEAAAKKHDQAVAKQKRDQARRLDHRKRNASNGPLIQPLVARIPQHKEEIVISHSRVKMVPVVVTKTKAGRIYLSPVSKARKPL
ncbi:MAG: hypothetical protein JWR51_4585 [Devosia sp.]|nr:hypothetical protein [Devosia sp.]